MIKAVIFDMDGTLINSEPLHERVRNSQLEKLNITDKIVADIAIGREKSVIYQMLIDKFNLDIDAKKWAKKDFIELVKLVKKEGIETTRGVYELFDYLKANNIKMAIGSSSEKTFVDFINDYLGFNKYLDAVITRDDVVNAKPEPDIFLKCLSELDVKASEALVIEDAESGTIASNKANIRCVCYDGGEKVLIKQNFSLATAVVTDLKQVINLIEKENN